MLTAMDADRPGAEHWVPESRDVDELRAAAHSCRGCELWRPATQVVFGAGAESARIMLVGEQPGDREDLAGDPFVGPAGRVLAEAAETAGLDLAELYVTNAVKHFRFEARGKRRIHKSPGVAHIDACRPWLTAEVEAVRPEVIVCLGATAARAVLRRTVTIGAVRGRVLDEPGPLGARVIVTTHPSALLRIREQPARAEAIAALADDLRLAAKAAAA